MSKAVKAPTIEQQVDEAARKVGVIRNRHYAQKLAGKVPDSSELNEAISHWHRLVLVKEGNA